MTIAARPAATVQDRRFAAAAALTLVLAAGPRLWAAYADHGVFWPDEIFQSVEQGHRLAFGYGIVPWEFVRGARSWVFPGLLAGLLRVGSAAGLDTGLSLMLVVKFSMAALSIGCVYLSMRLARSLAGPLAGILAGLFTGFFAPALLFGSRSLAETVTAPLVLGIVMIAARPGRNAQLLAGALAGLAIFLRYQNGIIAVGILAILVSERRIRDATYYAAASGTAGMLGGLLDWFTWGKPFAAFKMYLWFNLFKSADKFGAYPFSYYAEIAWNVTGPVLVVFIAGWIASARLAPKLLALFAAHVLIHCVVPHKEFRFLMPVMPLALALAAAGVADIAGRVRGGAVAALLVAAASAVYMTVIATQLTWAKIGFPSDRGDRSPWHAGEGINRLLSAAGERDDVCGLIVTGENFGWIGGYSYFHRDVDLYPSTAPGYLAAANYLIANESGAAPPGYRPVDRSREFVLLKRAGGCAPPPPEYKRTLGY